MMHDLNQTPSCHDKQSICSLDHCNKAQAVKPVSNFFFDTKPSLSSGTSRDGCSNVIKKKPYQCEYCEKSFSKPSALQPHIYTHTGERPFQCHIPGCNKRFAVISNLRRHFKVHEPKRAAKTRMSYKERILRVRRLATIAQLDQPLDSSRHNRCTSFDIPEPNVTQSVNTAWKLCDDVSNYSFEPTTFIGAQFFSPITSSYNDCSNITDMYLTFDNPPNPNDVDATFGWVRC